MTTQQICALLVAVFFSIVLGIVLGMSWATEVVTERCDKLGNVLLSGVPYECRRLDGQPKRVKVMA